MKTARVVCAGLWLGAPLAAGANEVVAASSLPDDLTQLSLEQLLDIQVTSVSRVGQSLSGAPAAVQVLSSEDLQRSGVKNLPEALRLVTGVQVARIDGHSWAITARGFNGALSDKLEVRLDGRSLYTPLFSGVIWEFQDIAIDDIERIEVIRGPGAALWGANAVNGVINIVTKSARSTQGTRISAVGGTELEHEGYVRHGMQVGEASALRFYAQRRGWGETANGSGMRAEDAREIQSAGLRGDFALTGRDELMLTLDATDAEMDSAQAEEGRRESMAGGALLARWTREYNEKADYQLQFSYDYFDRDIPGNFGEIRQQWDLEFRHRWHLWQAHDLVWGLGYRRSADEIRNSDAVMFDPAERNLDTFNLFLQDRIALNSALELTLGSRFEHNDFTGLEVQPNVRLAWRLGSQTNLWASLSRAARTPNRVDRDFRIPGPQPGSFIVVPNDSFDAEIAKVAELGWRQQLGATWSLDLATFYADYEDLRGLNANEAQQPIVSNEGEGHSFGAELTSVWSPSLNWRVWLGYSYLNLDFHRRVGSPDPSIEPANENDPLHQAQLRVAWDASGGLQVDASARYVDKLPDRGTPAYTELNLQLNYALSPGLTLSLGGRNLLDAEHPEFNDGSGSLIERSVRGGLRWDF